MALLDIQGMDPVRDKCGWEEASELSVLACDFDNDY